MENIMDRNITKKEEVIIILKGILLSMIKKAKVENQ